MAEYQGIVTGKKENGLLEVLIRPTSQGIPGVSDDINKQVCHCAADSSQVKIDALDRMGAGPGDWVLIRRNTSALLHNALILVGIPLAGFILGMFASYYMTSGFTLFSVPGVSLGTGIFLAAIFVARLNYMRTSEAATPVVISILKRASELESTMGEACSSSTKSDSCSSCHFAC